ncbi:hypothetical protein LCGC14_0911630 [marine sediment metagenome]|uniref:Glutamine amidotransferase domain-containing protein n=1 Tax=marine sediment metagenome TaxID=412755 RepID=A0A0F9RCI0_9ZZZZ
MTKEITVGIWEKAPFQGAVSRGIHALNSLLKSKKAPVVYNLVPITLKNLPPIDILVLDGGADIEPQRYSQKNQFSHCNPSRDKIEFGLFSFYHGKARISGICRGHQLINVALGGTLYQDIYVAGVANNLHSSPHQTVVNPAKDRGVRGGFLKPFLDSKEISVSSLHHQSIRSLGRDLYSTTEWRVMGTRFRVIEGIESYDGILRGVQSHPEFNLCPHDGYLFSYLMHVDTLAKDFFQGTSHKIAKKLTVIKRSIPKEVHGWTG